MPNSKDILFQSQSDFSEVAMGGMLAQLCITSNYVLVLGKAVFVPEADGSTLSAHEHSPEPALTRIQS